MTMVAYMYISDRVCSYFFESSNNGITCTMTSVVYANYVGSTVLLSAVKIIQYFKTRNFAEGHHSLRDKNR